MTAAVTPITLRIFISSPGDVVEERFLCEKVLLRLQDRYRSVSRIEPIFWEHEPLLASETFQTQLPSPAETDIVICILWSRIGTRLPPGVPGEGLTGTQYEFSEAVRGRRERGLPDLLVYRKDAPPLARIDLEEQVLAAIQQKRALDEFIKSWFHGTDGTLLAAFHMFRDGATFEETLEKHLQKLIEKRLREAHIAYDELLLQSATWKTGSPYRGLNFFDFEHESIFFGRTRAVSEIVDRLKRQAAAGRAFELVLGASGSGKSSLVRAGVLPLLSQPGVIPGVGLCRRSIFRPSDSTGDLFDGFASALLKPHALPELSADGTTPAQLARMLREQPDGVPLLIKGALSQAAAALKPASEASPQPQARLLFVVDQLEELFTLEHITEEQRLRFAAALSALASSGRSWVLATLRSDFYSALGAIPDLVALKEGDGQYDVKPPSAAEIGQMVRLPAQAAALNFEEQIETGERLEDILRDAAMNDPASLPLLEFTLDELYQRRNERGRLTFSAYEELGRLEGAIATRAESVFAGLPADVQSSLPSVFRQLATISGQAEDTVTRKQAPLLLLQTNAAQAEFTQAFIDARLFLTDQAADGTPVVRITHESLLTRWQRVKNWKEQDKELLRIRSRVLTAASNWMSENRRQDLLLSAGKPLDEAMQLANSDMLLESNVQDYIAQSRRRVRRNQRLRQFAIASLLVLTIISIISGAWAWRERGIASQARKTAENREQEAVKSKDELTQQLYDTSIAIAERELTQNHDIVRAGEILDGDSCPAELRGWEWHYLMRLRDGNRLPLEGHKAGLWGAEFSPDGKLVATCSIDGTLKIWEVATGKVRSIDADNLNLNKNIMETLGIPRIPITCLAFSPDGQRIATGSFLPNLKFNLLDPLHPKPDRDSPGLVRIWNVATGNLLASFQDQRGVVLSLTFSPDGQRIASSTINPENSFVVWDAQTSQVIQRVFGHHSQIHRLRYSPDGRLLAAAETDGVVKLWNAATFEEVLSVKAAPAPVVGISFSPPDGKRFATAGEDGLVRVWETANGKEILQMEGHSGSALDVRYSPDGTRIVSAGFDKTVRLWDAANGKPKITLRGHKELVWSVAFSPNGQQLVSASFDNTARIWDASPREDSLRAGEFVIGGHTERVNSVAFNKAANFFASGGWDTSVRTWRADTGEALAKLEGHDGVVWCVAISRDGRRIASASWDHTVKVWDVPNGKQLLSFTEHTAPVHSVAFSPDGTRLVSGAFDGQAKIWDAETGKVDATCDGFIFPVLAVAFSPDGQRVASGGSDRTLKIWDASTGKQLLSLKGHQASIHGLTFHPDGNRVATASWDQTVRIWDVEAAGNPSRNREVMTLAGHEDRVNGLAYSPDGSQLASASEDKTVRLWDVTTGEELSTPRHHRAVVWSVVFTGDGKRLISASWEKPDWIHAWRVDDVQHASSDPLVEKVQQSASVRK